jgi:hypothetical protein
VLLTASPTFADATTAPNPGTSSTPTRYLEVIPSTVQAGKSISLRANCIDNLQKATVHAALFKTVTLKYNGPILTGNAAIPATTQPGDYQLTLDCEDKTGAATKVLHVVARVEPNQGPATGGGGTAPGRNAPLLMGGGAVALIVGLMLAVAALRRRRFG